MDEEERVGEGDVKREQPIWVEVMGGYFAPGRRERMREAWNGNTTEINARVPVEEEVTELKLCHRLWGRAITRRRRCLDMLKLRCVNCCVTRLM